MRILRRTGFVFGVLTFAIGAGVGPAWAPGSLSLHEVRIAVRGDPKLVAEINNALKTSALKPEKVICSAGRHGNHWKYLGGARAAPYECTFGQRTLTIEADVTYYDAKGRPLGDVETADPRRAKTFREKNFRSTWAP